MQGGTHLSGTVPCRPIRRRHVAQPPAGQQAGQAGPNCPARTDALTRAPPFQTARRTRPCHVGRRGTPARETCGGHGLSLTGGPDAHFTRPGAMRNARAGGTAAGPAQGARGARLLARGEAVGRFSRSSRLDPEFLAS